MNQETKNKIKKMQKKGRIRGFPVRLITLIADEVAKTIVKRLPAVLPHSRKSKRQNHNKNLENAIFLDTSAIIDGRIFDVISLHVLIGTFVVMESILLELKHVADSKDLVKKARGRKGLELLEKLKKAKGIKIIVLPKRDDANLEVDEELIDAARRNKGRIITCDYNLEKKATISNVLAINVNTLANSLKVIAVPGESVRVKVLHRGKNITQGVGYLDDGTMIVVENASAELGQEVGVIVSRVIQTTAGRILFAKKI